jgi:hypothetical protein
MRVDMSAQVKLRKRLRTMRILTRIAIPGGLKVGCVSVALPLGGRRVLYVSMMNAETTAENRPVCLGMIINDLGFPD